MATAELPKVCGIDGLAKALAATGFLNGQSDSAVLFVPEHGVIQCSALTFLCAWGRQQRRQGRELLIRGSEAALRQLMRLDLYEHLGLAYQKEVQSPLDNPVVPLRLISNEQDMPAAAGEIYRLVERHFDNAPSFLPALQWAVGEITDNVLRHADAADPGAVYSEYLPREHRLDVAICDLGRGIYASLGETTFLYSHGHAITQAVRRGVTRSTDIGQGNGLAGVLEIVRKNGGDLQIWTGDALYRVVRGDIKGFVQMPTVPGTGVAFSLDTRVPVDLRDTWIAGRGAAFLPAQAGHAATALDSAASVGAETTGSISESTHGRIIGVARECDNTVMRGPAQRLRDRISRELLEYSSPLTLDFSAVQDATSSFLDELLGRLAREMGSDLFHKRLVIGGMSELIERMANVVIQQRLEGLSGSDRGLEEGLDG